MGEMVSMLILWVVVIGLMWFLLMRPQKKEQKRVQAMLASMEVGDTALTTSGFYGVIIDITGRRRDRRVRKITRTAASRCRKRRSLRLKNRAQSKIKIGLVAG